MWASADLRPVENDGQALQVTASASCLHAVAAPNSRDQDGLLLTLMLTLRKGTARECFILFFLRGFVSLVAKRGKMIKTSR